MSRSYKKIAIDKDGGKIRKQQANRRYRRATKTAMKSHREILPTPREITNTYDIRDWKRFSFLHSDSERQKTLRK